ncbi:MAG: hypothetical protein ABIJ21_07725 [Nanoarchaeota archaeon]
MKTLLQKLRQYATVPLAILGLATAASVVTAQPTIKADIRTNQDTIEYRLKASTEVKGIQIGLSTLETHDTQSGEVEQSALATVTVGPTTLYGQKVEEGGSAGFSMGGSIEDKVQIELMPVYLHLNSDGNTTGSTVWGTATAIAGDFTIDSTVDYEIVKDGEDSHAEFVGVKTEDVGVAVGRDYTGKLRGDIGFTAGDVGGLVEVTYNQEADQVGGIIMIAQHPGAVTSPAGAAISQNTFTIGEFSETKTYINGIANKPTEPGIVGCLAFAETETGVKFTPEIGYKTSAGIAGSIGTTVQEGEKSQPFAKISIVYQGAFGEAKITQDGVVTAYFGISTK